MSFPIFNSTHYSNYALIIEHNVNYPPLQNQEQQEQQQQTMIDSMLNLESMRELVSPPYPPSSPPSPFCFSQPITLEPQPATTTMDPSLFLQQQQEEPTEVVETGTIELSQKIVQPTTIELIVQQTPIEPTTAEPQQTPIEPTITEPQQIKVQPAVQKEEEEKEQKQEDLFAEATDGLLDCLLPFSPVQSDPYFEINIDAL